MPLSALVLLAGALWAAPVREASVPLHPLLVRDLADPANPLRPVLERQAGTLLLPGGRSSEAAVLGALSPLLAPASPPLERAASGVLARLLLEPRAAARLRAANPGLDREASPALARAHLATRPLRGRGALGPELTRLLEAARADAAVASLFEPARDPLEGLAFDLGALSSGDAEGAYIGHGGTGVVFAHPAAPGVAVKLVRHFRNMPLSIERPGFSFYTPDPENFEPSEMLKREERVARAFSAAGAGPRHLGRGTVGGIAARLSERVYGWTIDALIPRGRFGPEELRLARDMIARLEAARLIPGDTDLRNIMIGRTLLAPERRAYLVDGGWLEPEGKTEVLEHLDKRLYFSEKSSAERAAELAAAKR